MEESKSVVVVSVLEYLIECDYDYQSPTYPLCFGVYGDKLKAENAVWRCFENDSFGEGYVTWMSYEEFRSLGVHFFYPHDEYFGYYREDGLLLSVYAIEYHDKSIE